MQYFRIASVPILALLVLAALLYLTVSIVSLFASASGVSASTAPAGSYAVVLIGNNGDYTYNWDFLDDDDPRSSSVVDWGMRFIFAGSAVDVDYIKDRLDGKGNDPSISPKLDGAYSAKYSYMGDGPEQTGSNWDGDNGIKKYRHCGWNSGHMRIYAQSGEDHNYDASLGNYVIASAHADLEWKWYDWPYTCHKKFRSREIEEQAWRDRIADNLSSAPYNWTVGQSLNWYNQSAPGAEEIDIGGGNHKYQSDGMGTLISVAQD